MAQSKRFCFVSKCLQISKGLISSTYYIKIDCVFGTFVVLSREKIKLFYREKQLWLRSNLCCPCLVCVLLGYFLSFSVHWLYLKKYKQKSKICTEGSATVSKHKHLLSRHEIRRAEINFSCTKNGVFFTAASCTKDTIFGTARKKFWPFLFRDGFSTVESQITVT